MHENSKTFFDGWFQLGERVELFVDDAVCELSMTQYMAAATIGEEVAVGSLYVDEPISHEEYRRRNPDVPLSQSCRPFAAWQLRTVLIPGVGIWICEPVFDSAAKSWSCLEPRLQLVERLLDRPLGELPITPALFAVLPDQAPDLRGVDPLHFYDVETYTTLAESLTKRMGRVWLPSTVDETIRALLHHGHWSDQKSADTLTKWPIPRWLAAALDVRAAA